jgi:hypothetical protein
MPLRWRSRPRFDRMAAGERSLAGQHATVAKDASRSFERQRHLHSGHPSDLSRLAGGYLPCAASFASK